MLLSQPCVSPPHPSSLCSLNLERRGEILRSIPRCADLIFMFVVCHVAEVTPALDEVTLFKQVRLLLILTPLLYRWYVKDSLSAGDTFTYIYKINSEFEFWNVIIALISSLKHSTKTDRSVCEQTKGFNIKPLLLFVLFCFFSLISSIHKKVKSRQKIGKVSFKAQACCSVHKKR